MVGALRNAAAPGKMQRLQQQGDSCCQETVCKPRLQTRGRQHAASPTARAEKHRPHIEAPRQTSVMVSVITVRGYGSLLCGTGESERPGGGVRRLGGGPQFLEGQGLAVISQRVLLQLADGHGGEGTRQAFVRVLLT